MKRIVGILSVLFIILTFIGCSSIPKEIIATSEPSGTKPPNPIVSSISSTAPAIPSPLIEPNTVQVSETRSPETIDSTNTATFPATPTPEEGQLNFSTGEYNEWVYYLVHSNEAIWGNYELHRKKGDGTTDEYLGISGFGFSFADQYLYVDTTTDLGVWVTTRCNLDGSSKQRLNYRGMSRYFKDGVMYFYHFVS